MNKSTNGFLVISLDFELIWGVFDNVEPNQKHEYFQNTKNIIPEILSLFKKYEIHATWATVGMLYHKNWEEWEVNKPAQQPEYINAELSAYNFVNKTDPNDIKEMCFAPELIQEISEYPGQEIGTHTYSHYYCHEEGQTPIQFKQDLEQAIKMASTFNITLRSLVFPRNQLKEEYLKICNDLGITTVRSNPSSWYWQNTRSNALSTKLARTGDAYLPFGRKSYPLSEIIKKEGLPLQQKASRFYRPLENNAVLRKLKLKRLKDELSYAAKNNEVYHLWWHPHNFGDQPKESLNDLTELMKHFEFLRSKYGFQSLNMMELENIVI